MAPLGKETSRSADLDRMITTTENNETVGDGTVIESSKCRKDFSSY